MNANSNRFIPLLLAVLSAGISSTSFASDSQHGVVLAVDSVHSTSAFIARNRLPHAQTEGGRIAVVKLDKAASDPAAYALVYVPASLSVARNDQVEVLAKDGSSLSVPGSAVVTRVSQPATAVR
jgi:hypothetical protein